MTEQTFDEVDERIEEKRNGEETNRTNRGNQSGKKWAPNGADITIYRLGLVTKINAADLLAAATRKAHQGHVQGILSFVAAYARRQELDPKSRAVAATAFAMQWTR